MLNDEEIRNIYEVVDNDDLADRVIKMIEANEILEKGTDPVFVFEQDKGETRKSIEGEIIVRSVSSFSDEFKESKYQVWKANGGFGCKAGIGGSAVFATCVTDKEEARMRINQVIGVIK